MSRTTLVVATGSSLVIGHYFGAFLGTGVIQSVEKITNYAIIVAKQHVKRVIYLILSRIPDPVAEPMMHKWVRLLVLNP